MNFAVAGFDWDAGNREKCGRHGVALTEIEFALSGELRVSPDLRHSDHEARYIAVGVNTKGRPVFVAFTFRIVDGARRLRPISARYMHAREIDRYDPPRS